jgi:ferrous iron transport protein A
MRENLIRIFGFHVLLSELPNGAHAVVARIAAASHEIGEDALRRLGELGFIPGEPVQLLRRGPGGREPIAVQIGDTMFGLRLLEAQSIEVSTASPAAAGVSA